MIFDPPYYQWLKTDVPDIVTDQEKAAFNKLTTDEERERFIESFWERRNPDPGNPENKFKQEYYRRIVFANERFSTTVPGWQTDRGRIYVQFGPPDRIESSPSGGTMPSCAEPGPTQTVTVHYPLERWFYRRIENMGSNPVLIFVDPTSTGDYRLTMDCGEKDALMHVPLHDRGEEFTAGTKNQLEALAAASCSPSTTKFPDLRAALTSNLAAPNPMPLLLRTYYFDATDETDIVYVALELANRDLQFQNRGDVMHAEVDIYGQVQSLGGRIVNRFERAFAADLRAKDQSRSAGGTSTFVESFPLRPGHYKLRVALKDAASGRLEILDTGIIPISFGDSLITSSPLILASAAEPQAGQEDSAITLGGDKFIPNPRQAFSRQEELRAYLQVYNLAVDPATHRASVYAQYEVLRDGKPIIGEAGDPAQLTQATLQVTLDKRIPLQSLPPGQYTLQIKITDRLRGRTITPSATFLVH